MTTTARVHGAPSSGVTLQNAVSSALVNNVQLRSDRERVKAATGSYLVAKSPFDFSLNASVGHERISTPFTPDIFQLDNTTRLAVGARQQLEFGLTIEPTVELLRRDSVIPAVVSGTVAPQNIAVVRLQIRQPLLRGFGAGTSGEAKANARLVRAAEHDARFSAAVSASSAAAAYWNYVGAVRFVRALEASEARARRLIKETSQLVTADERPKSDLEPLNAILAQRTRDRLLAELSVYETRTVLGLEMGIDPERVEELGAPVTPFPPMSAAVSSRSADEKRGLVGQRDDVRAAQVRAEASQILLDAAENRRLPRLDVVAQIGYAGIIEGSGGGDVFRSLGSNVSGLNAGASLVLEWPVAASAGRGEHQRAVAARRQAELALLDVDRRASLQLAVALKQLDIARRALVVAQKAFDHQKAAATNERTKSKNGLATLIDVIVSDDRTTSAELALSRTHVSYAQAVVQLAFAEARLVRGEGTELTVDLRRLVSPK